MAGKQTRLMVNTPSTSTAIVSPIKMLNKSKEARAKHEESITAWKKKSWLDFCKIVMEQDTRYTLMPLTDYHARMKDSSMLARVNNAEGVFSNFCLTRTGGYTDVFIIPCAPQLGVMVDAGSKYSRMTLTAYPSKGIVWPVLKIADELERMYSREVSVEVSKHNGGTKEKHNEQEETPNPNTNVSPF